MQTGNNASKKVRTKSMFLHATQDNVTLEGGGLGRREVLIEPSRIIDRK